MWTFCSLEAAYISDKLSWLSRHSNEVERVKSMQVYLFIPASIMLVFRVCEKRRILPLQNYSNQGERVYLSLCGVKVSVKNDG